MRTALGSSEALSARMTWLILISRSSTTPARTKSGSPFDFATTKSSIVEFAKRTSPRTRSSTTVTPSRGTLKRRARPSERSKPLS